MPLRRGDARHARHDHRADYRAPYADRAVDVGRDGREGGQR